MTTITNQTDIFSMFNLLDDHAEKKKKEAEEKRKKEEEQKKLADEERKAKQEEIRKKAQESVAKASEKKEVEKKEDKFELNEETVIRYYGESIEITAYFTPEELVEGLLIKKTDGETERKPLEPEMLRKRMEKDFPELVKSHTEIVFIKQKNIVIPTMKAKKKGNCSEEELSNDSSSSIIGNHKIPFSILRDFISIAKLYGELSLEVHGDIYWDLQKKKFFLDIPGQLVNRYWVEITEDAQDIVERVEDAIKVLEIHSHHSMIARPSEQDNASERVPGMLYAIVGKVNQFFPELFVRQFLSEERGHIKLNPERIFEYPFFDLADFDVNKIEVEA
jgi:hypothetical protein